MVYIVPGKGIGKPDYSDEVSRGIYRAGLDLKSGQSLKSFYVIFTPVVSPFIPWVKPVLVPAATGHLVDAETGIDMPYVLSEGYIISLIQDSFGFKVQADVWILVDTMPVAQLSVSAGGLEVYRNRVIPFSTQVLDPTGIFPHLIDVQVTNPGGANLEGSVAVSAIVEAVGTPPLPTTKTVKCNHCGHQWSVPFDTTKLICSKCGELTIVYTLSSFRRTS